MRENGFIEVREGARLAVEKRDERPLAEKKP